MQPLTLKQEVELSNVVKSMFEKYIKASDFMVFIYKVQMELSLAKKHLDISFWNFLDAIIIQRMVYSKIKHPLKAINMFVRHSEFFRKFYNGRCEDTITFKHFVVSVRIMSYLLRKS